MNVEQRDRRVATAQRYQEAAQARAERQADRLLKLEAKYALQRREIEQAIRTANGEAEAQAATIKWLSDAPVTTPAEDEPVNSYFGGGDISDGGY